MSQYKPVYFWINFILSPFPISKYWLWYLTKISLCCVKCAPTSPNKIQGSLCFSAYFFNDFFSFGVLLPPFHILCSLRLLWSPKTYSIGLNSGLHGESHNSELGSIKAFSIPFLVVPFLPKLSITQTIPSLKRFSRCVVVICISSGTERIQYLCRSSINW